MSQEESALIHLKFVLRNVEKLCSQKTRLSFYCSCGFECSQFICVVLKKSLNMLVMAVAGVIMIQGNNAYDDELSDVDDKSKNKYNNDDNYNDISEGHPKPIFPNGIGSAK